MVTIVLQTPVGTEARVPTSQTTFDATVWPGTPANTAKQVGMRGHASVN